MQNPSKTTTRNKHFYRPELDGLRAIAVSLVILFHAFPQKLTGGFVGVDIFFVISGYLISTIILDEINDGRFTIVDFYKKRINRIYPALIFVLIACVVLSNLLLFRSEIKAFNLSLFFSTIFSANLYFLKTLNYFDNHAEDHPLLHLWSLGVEEQFYILWPVLLLYLAKKDKHFSIRLIATILAASFLLNVLFVSKLTSEVFYLPFTRFWELGAGSLCAFLLKDYNDKCANQHSSLEFKIHCNYLIIIGFLLIGLSATFVKTTQQFPGWIAILPVLGAALIIVYGHQSDIAKKILGNRFVVFIGLISYPLYLWHWPILSFGHIHYGYLMDKNTKLFLLLISVVLAIVTYYCIETPLRYKLHSKYKTVILFIILMMIGISSIVDNLNSIDGVNTENEMFFTEYKDYIGRYDWTTKNRTYCGYIDFNGLFSERLPAACLQRKQNKTNVMLWGDSHAFQLYYGLHKNLGQNFQIIQITSAGCRPLIEPQTNNQTKNCMLSNNKAIAEIKRLKPEVVIVAQKDLHESTDWNAFAKLLHGIGVIKVILVGPAPQWNQSLYRFVAKNYYNLSSTPKFLNSAVLNKDLIKVDGFLKSKYGDNPFIKYVSLIDVLCKERLGCLTFVEDADGKELTTFDYGHFGLKTSSFVSKTIISALPQHGL